MVKFGVMSEYSDHNRMHYANAVVKVAPNFSLNMGYRPYQIILKGI